MKRRKWLIVVLGAVLFSLALAPLVTPFLRDMDLRREIELARKAGIPMSGDEVAALIPKVAPEDNAAPLYAELRDAPAWRTLAKDQLARMDRPPTRARTADLRAVLEAAADSLSLIERATDRPGCDFARDWSLGPAMVFPEYSKMLDATRLLGIRASLAAREGRAEDALADARRIDRIARHACSEPVIVAMHFGRKIETMGWTLLVALSRAHPNEPAYRDALRKALRRPDGADFRKAYSAAVFIGLTTADYCETVGGLVKLGVPADEMPDGLKLRMILQRGSRARYVRAYREALATWDDPPRFEALLLQAANELSNWPAADHYFGRLSSEGEDWRTRREAHRVAFEGVLRYLERGEADVSGLHYPGRSAPLDVHLEGGRLVAEFIGAGRPDEVRIVVP